VALKSGLCSFGFLSSCGSWVDQKLFEGYGEGKIYENGDSVTVQSFYEQPHVIAQLQIMSSTCGNLETR
jgi:hypothetical protein